MQFYVKVLRHRGPHWLGDLFYYYGKLFRMPMQKMLILINLKLSLILFHIFLYWPLYVLNLFIDFIQSYFSKNLETFKTGCCSFKFPSFCAASNSSCGLGKLYFETIASSDKTIEIKQYTFYMMTFTLLKNSIIFVLKTSRFF